MKVLLILAAVLHLGCLEEVREPFRVPDLCTEVGPDQGNCGDYNVRWFFNPQDGQCKQFMYSGCGGNQNNFKTLEECEKMCKGIPEKDDQQEMTSGDDQPPTETASTESTPKEAKEASEKEAKQDKGVNTETVEDQETNLDNKSEDDAEENDEEGLDDGEEDEDLINKFLNVGDGMSVEDSQALKEAMAAFDVSVLQEVPSEEQINMEDEQQEQREQQVEQQQEQQPDQQQQQQQQQQQIEGQAEMNENINQQHEESQAAHGDQPNEDMAAGSVTEQQTGNNEDDGYMEETSQQLRSFLDGLHVAITPEDRETIQEGISEYGATVMEAQQDVAEGMESVQYQEQQANQEKDISGEVKGAQQELDSANAELEEAHADISSVNVPPEPAMEGSDGDITDGDDDEDDDDDDEPEGIDVEEEYPPLKGMLSPEDQATLAEAISAFDVVEAVSNRREMEGEVVARIPLSEDVSEESLDQENVAKEETEAGKSEQTTTSSPSHSTTEATEQQSTEDVIHEDKAAILNPNEMNDQDRQMLNELVSNYDVNVVQERSDPDKTEDSEKSDETNEPADSEAEDTESNGLLSPRCTLPPVSGPCRARMIRWYFDMDTGKCTSFVYGGCRGNGNRFISRRKCMASCLATRDQRPVFLPTNGLPVTPTHNPAIHPMPTQSPTKKITFMMPLLGLFNKRTPPSSAGMSSFRQLPQPTQSQMPQMADRGNKGRRMTPSSAFQGRDVMSTIRHGSMAMKTRPQPATEETESNGDQFRPPFSPFRYLITRAMFKTTINHREAPSAPSDGQKVQSNPLPSRIRIVLPRGQAAKMPSFQKQQPVPKLGPMRPLMQLIEQLRLPLFDRGRARAFGQRDDNNNENMDRPPAPAIFAPKMVKKSEFESLNHDNRHLNMVSPNNKFTLLQVFVNKHGGHQNMADPAVRMRQPAGPTNKLAPSRMSPEPFNQAIRSFQPSDNRPMLSMRPAYGPYQTGVWTGSQPALPPHMSYVHYHQHGYPFQYAIHRPFGGIPLPQMRPQPMARRPPIIRPLVITTREEEAEEEESDQPHYACLLPLAPGPCKSYQTKWYYNRDSGKCEIFYYTGCAGNANNFETWEECAATCLETPSEPKSTIPSEVSDSSRTSDDEKAEEDERPDTIIVTSTRYPDNEAEARQAIEEAKTEAPSADNKKDTAEEREEPKERVEPEEKEQMNEVQKEEEEQSKQNELVDKHVVISEVGAMSTHYILLLAVITIVALAVIVLVTISIVHLCRKMRAGKKERVLEAVIKQQLSAEAPHLVYTTKPAPEQTEKPQV